MPQFRLRINDQERDFEAVWHGNRWHLSSTELRVDVEAIHLGDGRYLLRYTDDAGVTQRIRLAGHRAGDSRQLWVDGRVLVAGRVRQQATASSAVEASLSASIPAVVSQVLVSEGDTVSAGEKLILLESMKMVIPIQAPADGRVVKIHCAAGDSVPAGLLLVEFEPL